MKGPLTYHGTELNLDWRVRATADVPWAIDPKTEADLVLVRGSAPPGKIVQGLQGGLPAGQADRRRSESAGGLCCAYWCLGPLALLSVGLGLYELAYGQRDEGHGWLSASGVFLVLLVAAVVKERWVRVAQRKVGDATVRVEPRRLGPGEEAQVTVTLRPAADLELGKVTATLLGREVVVRGTGTDERTTIHELHRRQVTLSSGERIAGGTEHVLHMTFRIPEDAPPSLHAQDNDLVWSVDVHAELQRWPDWNEDVTLVVFPA